MCRDGAGEEMAVGGLGGGSHREGGRGGRAGREGIG